MFVKRWLQERNHISVGWDGGLKLTTEFLLDISKKHKVMFTCPAGDLQDR